MLTCALSTLFLHLHIPNVCIKFNKSLWVFYNTEKEKLKIKYPHSTKFDEVDKKIFSYIKQAEREKRETRNTGSGSTIIAESVELGFNVVQERSGFIERPFEIRFVLGQYITVSFLQKEKRIKSNLTNKK